MSLTAAGLPGWKCGWCEVNSPRKAVTSHQTADTFRGTVLTIHAPSDLPSHLVTPTDRSKVGLVIHETGIEAGLDVWA